MWSLPKSARSRCVTAVSAALIIVVSLWAFQVASSLFRWRAMVWLPSYLTATEIDPAIPDHQKHLIFLMVDHYEHGTTDKATQANKEWCDSFRELSNSYRDNYGNRFRYTWFYPYDHHNAAIMRELSLMAYEGHGEVEMHWHLTSALGLTPADYPAALAEAVSWYQQFGAMITAGADPRTAFGYVAGSWDLDSARPGPKSHGITNQITSLFNEGCYADFTYSTIGTPAQPAKVNSLFYVTDDPLKPKSHNDGEDVLVGSVVNDRLMIFEGPIAMDWHGGLEYAAIEADPRFSHERVDKWIKANIHVIGRPEWVFVKVYSHGAQSKNVVIAHDMEVMLKNVIARCEERGIALHFMSAREAFNVVKAAEAGQSGNPEEYRDYFIPRYLNMEVHVDSLSSQSAVEESR